MLPILKPYKLVSREFAPDPTVIEARGRRIGDAYFGLIAGPCTVETREQTLETARAVAAAGATMLRGGAFKPRTSPYTFQGLGSRALDILAEAREETGLPIVTELMDPRHVEAVVDAADVIQIGARNMQNFLLLAEVGRADKPVLLKRGLSASVEELLMAAEYVVQGGQRADHPLRARDQDVRAGDALHARHRRGPGAQAGDAPAGDRRPVARRRAARARAAAGARGGRGRARTGSSSRCTREPEQALCDGPQQIPDARVRRSSPTRSRALVSLMGKEIG